MPYEVRDTLQIEVDVAFTTEDAIRHVDRGVIDVRGAVVVIDTLTNDVRGTRMRPALSAQEMVRGIDRLRSRLRMAGAAATIVCQLKPMQILDVTPFNQSLSDYLRAQNGGFGCRTQIRLSDLSGDGYHVIPQADSVIDKTYACAIMGVPAPCPTPHDEFVPDHLRRRWEKEWPGIGERAGRSANSHAL